ncbi:MAG: MFS transporter, partial [Minicystis sp.]
MKANRNLALFLPYLICSLEGVCHGVYLLWLTVHKGVSPLTAATLLAAGDLALLLFEVPTGLFADRLGARASLLLGSACQILGLALFWQTSSLPALALGALAIALGDAFRHGADEALLYRSCAAAGDPTSFGRRLAGAHAWSLFALVTLTTLGGVLAEQVSFDVAWALELALSFLGLGLAWAMIDLPATALDPEDEDAAEPGIRKAIAGLRARVPWALLVPAVIIGTLATTGEFFTQTESRGRIGPSLVAMLIASGQLL